MYCDFHTHDAACAMDTLKLVSVAELSGERPPGVFYALELHPWRLPGSFAGLPGAFLRAAPHADALGEVGLDRLRGPSLEVQRKFLRAVLRLAADLGKPVVFHCVRAYPELLAECRPFPSVPKLLHGFPGGETRRKMLTDAGFLLSSSRELPPGGGLETDDSGRDIREVYRACAADPDDPEFETRFRAFLSPRPPAQTR